MAEDHRSGTLEPGYPHPLGATCECGGVNFALFSAHATRVELCLFDSQGVHEIARYTLPERNNHVWHGFLPEAGPGTVYAYRVHGPFEPHLGHRFNPRKLVLDPYARRLTGDFGWHDSLYTYDPTHPDRDLEPDSRDNAPYLPKCIVYPDLAGPLPRAPRVPWPDTLLYECHVRGMTMSHPEVDDRVRGTALGLASPPILEYLKALGVTSVELMPVQAFTSEPFLIEKGLVNYWGYNTVAFFAPHYAYVPGGDPATLREAIDRIHDAGLEVILDVVYNHTAEGNRLGPTYSFRGIDNLSYYRLQAENRRYYVNDTGCGNTLDLSHPRVLQLVMDSLRYWVRSMQVDGFRFDLGTVLGRERHGFDPGSGFFDDLRQCPMLAGVKLISEPWDIGPGGYQLGRFPVGWSEWNDRFRDAVRRYWRGDGGMLPELARRVHGSSDLFEHSGRRPSASINFVSSHDGFTLHDLVSYRERHNELNGEQNRDGHSENFSDNYGVEGPSSDPAINALRQRQKRNLLATTVLSQGVPMLLGGDEIGRSQQGNNNAYCQDNALTWLDWSQASDSGALARYVARLTELRRDHPQLRVARYLHEAEHGDDECMLWFNTRGEPMRPEQWQEQHQRSVCCLLAGVPGRLAILFHAGRDAIDFAPPALPGVAGWRALLDTRDENGVPLQEHCPAGEAMAMEPCSLVVLEELTQGEGDRHEAA
jgi:glycogen operon protein